MDSSEQDDKVEAGGTPPAADQAQASAGAEESAVLEAPPEIKSLAAMPPEEALKAYVRIPFVRQAGRWSSVPEGGCVYPEDISISASIEGVEMLLLENQVVQRGDKQALTGLVNELAAQLTRKFDGAPVSSVDEVSRLVTTVFDAGENVTLLAERVVPDAIQIRVGGLGMAVMREYVSNTVPPLLELYDARLWQLKLSLGTEPGKIRVQRDPITGVPVEELAVLLEHVIGHKDAQTLRLLTGEMAMLAVKRHHAEAANADGAKGR